MRKAIVTLKERLAHLSRRRFVRDVTILASGSVAVSLIGLAVTPLVTRLYGPDAFGALGVFNSILVC
jgi:O-antigen/teichoic acid export membrane protein